MPQQSEALTRLTQFNRARAVPTNRRNTGVRFTIDQLKELLAALESLSEEDGGYLNNEGHSDAYFDKFERATGVVFMVGKEKVGNNFTLEVLPVVGELDKDGEPRYDFIIQYGEYGFTNFNGGGGGNQRTPPPSATN